MKTTVIAAALALTASGAFAGNLASPESEQEILPLPEVEDEDGTFAAISSGPIVPAIVAALLIAAAASGGS